MAFGKKIPPFKGLKARHLQMLMLFFCQCSNYLMRVNISIAIFLMTDLNSTSSDKVFNWTVAQQSAVQSILFVGHFVISIAAGVLVTKLNSKYLLLGTTFISIGTSLATPALVTAGGYYVLLATRFILGLMQGFMTPCVMVLMARWVPLTERGFSGAFVFGGAQVGNLLSFSISGWLGSQYGWPSTFYFPGAFAAVWCIFWVLIGAESTDTCSFISTEEKKFIQEQLTQITTLPKKAPVPWKKILKSKTCWAIIIASGTYNWGYWILLTEIPTYFNSVLNLSLSSNGILTALPYFCNMVLLFPSSYASDLLVEKKIISVITCRKTFNSFGQLSASICLLIIGLTTNQIMIISMYVIGATLLSFSSIGHNMIVLDILPNSAGFMIGLMNCIANVASIIGPLFAGAVIHDASNANEWRIVFYVSAALFFIGTLAFIFMVNSEDLEFNEIPEDLHNKTSNEDKFTRTLACNLESTKINKNEC